MYQGTKHLTHHLDSHCSHSQPSQPPWPDLQDSSCSGSFLFCLFVQAFPAEIFSPLTPCWCLAHSKYSINISSLFLHTSFNMLPSPLPFHSAYAALLALSAHKAWPIKISIFQNPSPKSKSGKVERVGSNPSPCCVMLGKSLNISELDQIISKILSSSDSFI